MQRPSRYQHCVHNGLRKWNGGSKTLYRNPYHSDHQYWASYGAFKRSFKTCSQIVEKLKLFICLCASLLLLHSEAFISVNIDPEDLDRVSDFFHSIIINEQPQAVIQTPTPRVITYIIYKKMNMLGVHRIMSYIRLFNNPFFCWEIFPFFPTHFMHLNCI